MQELVKRCPSRKDASIGTAAVVASCRSCSRLVEGYYYKRGPLDPSSCAVAILDRNSESGLSQTLAMGAVDEEAKWTEIDPPFEFMVRVEDNLQLLMDLTYTLRPISFPTT